MNKKVSPKMKKLWPILYATLVPFVLCTLPAAYGSITFTPRHIYSTYTDSTVIGDVGYRNIIEYDASGVALGSMVVPSLAQTDVLKGIAGPAIESGFELAGVAD